MSIVTALTLISGLCLLPLSQTATNLCSRPADFHSFIFVGFLGFGGLKSASLLADYQSNKTCFQSYAHWKAVEY